MARRPPRDPGQLARDIDLTIELRQIREWGALKEGLAPRFGELFLLAGHFCFSLGLILTLIFALPQENEVVYNIWLLWSVGYILMTIVILEFLLRKFRIVRRVIELNLRRIERLEKLEKRLAAAPAPPPEGAES